MKRGSIELESGTWHWRIADRAQPRGRGRPPTRGTRPPDEVGPDAREAGGALLVLEATERPQEWMTRALPSRWEGPIPAGDLAELARDPDRRQLVDSSGTVWRVEVVPNPAADEHDGFERAPTKVKISREGGEERTLLLPEGRALGALARDELLGLIDA